VRVTALLAPASYTVDPWDPGYGVALDGDLDGDLDGRASTARLELDVELPAASWRPVSPSPRPDGPDGGGALPRSVLFLDGVRRIDARVWAHGAAPQPIPGVAASLAAGLVCCSRRSEARVVAVRVDRSLYTSCDAAGDLVTRHATYTARRVDTGLDELPLAVQRRLSELELELALAWCTGAGGDLLVVDGPLRGRTHLPHTVGYVKTHHATYLPQPQSAVVGALAAGQRTPVFVMGTSWQRHSWYLRLPGPAAGPWSAVVRLECSADLSTADAVALADLTAVLLPPMASTPHKDPRAPQNLVPIGGLERQLRHRLGDATLLYRALRAAA
jgi:hypothetical protein